ncbi:MAG: pyridoxamine 5'-phosphate oxidase family protein [Dehalococcoidia bacterium]|nr:pyridoxamine 5'-phosphate oxidase family protein [Dehalococcoidia bacterium]
MINKLIADFLSEVHIAILAIHREKRAPHSTPIWYQYEPNDTLWFMADPKTQKGKLMETGTPVSLVMQTETAPYRYVSIAGQISDVAKGDMEQELRPISRRYLGVKGGDEYVASFESWSSNRYTIKIDRVMSMGISED